MEKEPLPLSENMFVDRNVFEFCVKLKFNFRIVLIFNSCRLNFKQECIPVGCVPPACCPYLPACTARRGVYLVPGGCTGSRGDGCTLSRRGGYLPRYSPPVDRMTDRCKNITLPQTSFAGGNDKKNVRNGMLIFPPSWTPYSKGQHKNLQMTDLAKQWIVWKFIRFSLICIFYGF